LFVFSLLAGFRKGAANVDQLNAAMAGFPLPPADGTRAIRGGDALAAVARWIVVPRDEHAAPSWQADRQLLFAGDVRLYNRPELLDELGEPAGSDRDRSDLELARLAYLRWGHATPAHLVGDFAIAAWEQTTGSLFVARDHFGVRPVYYRQLPDAIAVASDVRQLLALVDRPADELADEQILDGLLHRSTDARRTYFRGITRIPAGHALFADASGVRLARYWLPPTASASDRAVSYADNCERLRAIFSRAVRDRLESAHPIVAHSSGGFDSSTIVMAADAIYRAEPARPPLTLAGGIAPGHAADESRFMDAVAASVTFPEERWKIVADQDPERAADVSRGAPILRHGPAGGPRRDIEIARERGARVLLSGVLGDTLWHAKNVRRDMIHHGRWIQAARDVLRAGFNGLTLHRFVDAGLGVFPVNVAAGAGSWLFDRPPPPPGWLGPSLRAAYASERDRARRDLAAVDWPSHLLRGVWAQLTNPSAGRVVESFVGYAAEDGIELRAPYADVRLAEAVMKIPWQQREPRGHYRRTGRDALGPMLPAPLSQRIGQPSWISVWTVNARRNAMTVAPFIEHGPWRSEAFVDRGIARGMLRQVQEGRDGDRPMLAIMVTQFGVLEAWIRQLLG
jgi:asparagine synthase (glutamine-hydrolysing)